MNPFYSDKTTQRSNKRTHILPGCALICFLECWQSSPSWITHLYLQISQLDWNDGSITATNDLLVWTNCSHKSSLHTHQHLFYPVIHISKPWVLNHQNGIYMLSTYSTIYHNRKDCMQQTNSNQHLHTQTDAHIQTDANTHTHTHTHVHTHTHTHTHTLMCTLTHLQPYVKWCPIRNTIQQLVNCS